MNDQRFSVGYRHPGNPLAGIANDRVSVAFIDPGQRHAGMTTSGGGAVVEFVLSVPLFVLLAVTLVFFCRFSLYRHRALRAARFGTALSGTGVLDDGLVAGEVSNYLERLTSADGFIWKVEVGRFVGTPAARFYNLTRTSVRGSFPKAGFEVSEEVTAEKEGGE